MQVNLDKWHHCEVDKQEFVKLLQKSDYQGFKHMFIFFGSLFIFGYLAYATWGTWWSLLFFLVYGCLLYTSPSPRDATLSRMPSSA